MDKFFMIAEQIELTHADETFSPLLTELLGWSLFGFIVAAAIFFIIMAIYIIRD